MAAPNVVNVTSIYGKTVGAALGTTLDHCIIGEWPDSGKLLKVNSIIVANVDGSSAADVDVIFFHNGST